MVIIGGQVFPKLVAQQRKALLQRIAAEGYEAVMEAMAYTFIRCFGRVEPLNRPWHPVNQSLGR